MVGHKVIGLLLLQRAMLSVETLIRVLPVPRETAHTSV